MRAKLCSVFDFDSLFSEQGPLARVIKDFRARPFQLEMARAVAEVIANNTEERINRVRSTFVGNVNPVPFFRPRSSRALHSFSQKLLRRWRSRVNHDLSQELSKPPCWPRHWSYRSLFRQKVREICDQCSRHVRDSLARDESQPFWSALDRMASCEW